MLARAWAGFLDSAAFTSSSRIFGMLCEDIRTLFDATDTIIVEELTQATGGSPDGLAFLIVKHMAYILCSQQEILDADTTLRFATALRLVIDLVDSTPAMIPLLLSHGIVPATVRTICVFDWENIPARVVSEAMRILLRLLTESPDHRHIVDALRAGLLKAIVSSIPMEIEHVFDLLTLILPAHMVHHTVLTKLRRWPPALEKTIKSFDPEVLQSPLFAAWRAFYKLVIQRTEIQASFDSDPPPPQLACDNMKVLQRFITRRIQ